MKYKTKFIASLLVFTGVFLFSSGALTRGAEDEEKGTILLTIFLKHDQSRNVTQINEYLGRTGFWKKFPPAGTEVVSWYVMMGIGQVVTLRLPADQLREVNLAVEENAWGAFRTEFYPTYDFRPVWMENRGKADQQKR